MSLSQHLPLAPRDLLILSALADGPLHGYGILRSVSEGSDVLLDPGNLYRALRRMRSVGWITESEDETDEENRRLYSLSTLGQEVLRAEVARLQALLRRVRSSAALVPREAR
jgi:DNA-binding PadR family transcriptional regulator